MQLKCYKDYKTLSLQVATEIASMVKLKPGAVLCFASGDTPRLAYTLLSEMAAKEGVDFSGSIFIGLDEWVGIAPENEGSCSYFLHNTIFKPLKIPSGQIHLFNALSGNLAGECVKMDKIIFEKGGIDLMIVGVGMNGHIGFNEPGTSFASLSHVAELEEITKSVGQKYFDGPVELGKGITIGFGHLMNTKKVFLMANGPKKAEVIKKTIEGPVTESFPASIMQQHANGFIVIDEEAGSLLGNF